MLATQDAPRMARKPIAKKTTGRPAKAVKVAEEAEGEPSLVTALRQAIIESGKSRNAVAVLAGVTSTNIDRFMAGAGINIATAGKIADVLGYVLVKRDSSK